MNTALIVHLLTLAEHHIHGRHFTPFYVPECFQWVKVRTDPSRPVFEHRLICGFIHVWQRGFQVRWR
jgi:hypothetical protein